MLEYTEINFHGQGVCPMKIDFRSLNGKGMVIKRYEQRLDYRKT